ncbi:MAG: DUF6152 family protein [Pseudomonadota bacterium]|nr:DUF6152 family protein [Pseudomonadota bacterium]
MKRIIMPFDKIHKHYFLLFSLALIFCGDLYAHHSSAMFDKTNVLKVKAVVKEFQWANPHVWIQIYIPNQNNKEEWSIEGIGINTLFRRGWRPNSFQPGDKIDISFNPMLDGTPAGLFIGAKFEDGKILGRWENTNN